MTQSCHTGVDVGAVPLFLTTNEIGTVVPENVPLAGGVMLVTTRSGKGMAASVMEAAATAVLLLKFVPSPTVPVALVVTVNQYVAAVKAIAFATTSLASWPASVSFCPPLSFVTKRRK